MRGIKVRKEDASKLLSTIDRKLLGDYRIESDDKFVYIPIEEIMNSDIEHETVIMEFRRKKRRETMREYLERNIPSELLEYLPSSFDTVGDIAIIDIKHKLEEYKTIIGEAILTSTKVIRTVYRKSSKVEGTYRIRGLELLAGKDNPETIYTEHGVRFHVNLKKVYFSPRLSTEHIRIAEKVQQGESVLDLFCAQAPFAFHILNRVATSVVSVDINPFAKTLIEKSLNLNRLKSTPELIIGDAAIIAEELYQRGSRFKHIIMNHPSGAVNFLVAASKLLEEDGSIYFYNFAPRDFEEYNRKLISQHIPNFKIVEFHRVRNSSPTEYHMCTEIKCY